MRCCQISQLWSRQRCSSAVRNFHQNQIPNGNLQAIRETQTICTRMYVCTCMCLWSETDRGTQLKRTELNWAELDPTTNEWPVWTTWWLWLWHWQTHVHILICVAFPVAFRMDGKRDRQTEKEGEREMGTTEDNDKHLLSLDSVA